VCRGLDATEPAGGWRDLTKSKHELTKGRDQLGMLYQQEGYHIADEVLGEHTACTYLARSLPLNVLEAKVRVVHIWAL
jgi:hypothetical protein